MMSLSPEQRQESILWLRLRIKREGEVRGKEFSMVS
jgi:hypothetical protein